MKLCLILSLEINNKIPEKRENHLSNASNIIPMESTLRSLQCFVGNQNVRNNEYLPLWNMHNSELNEDKQTTWINTL